MWVGEGVKDVMGHSQITHIYPIMLYKNKDPDRERAEDGRDGRARSEYR